MKTGQSVDLDQNQSPGIFLYFVPLHVDLFFIAVAYVRFRRQS
jgi:hypothetical protein